jgi:hypothetical protein
MFLKYFLKKIFTHIYIPYYHLFINKKNRPLKFQMTNLIIIKIQNIKGSKIRDL